MFDEFRPVLLLWGLTTYTFWFLLFHPADRTSGLRRLKASRYRVPCPGGHESTWQAIRPSSGADGI